MKNFPKIAIKIIKQNSETLTIHILFQFKIHVTTLLSNHFPYTGYIHMYTKL